MGKISTFIKEKSLVIIIILLLVVILLSYSTIKLKTGYTILTEREKKFELLSPSIAWMETEDFLAQQEKYNINYRELKKQVLNELEKSPNEKYGFYFEDLTTGAWIGVNEKEKFIPMSLFKVPLMVAILKKVEQGEISLDQKAMIDSEDLDMGSGPLALIGAGYEMTIKELLTKMIQTSDNTAMNVLSRFTTNEDYMRTVSIIGLPNPSEENAISPKEYANIFRLLYFSTYLRRPFSEIALTIMLDTDFASQLPAGLPADVKISHKVGFDVIRGFYHDCGIVYLEDHHYLICIMSKNNIQEKADKMMSQLSKIVYDFNKNMLL